MRGPDAPALQERQTILSPEEVLVWIHAPKAGAIPAQDVAADLINGNPELPVLLTHPDGFVAEDAPPDLLRLDAPLDGAQAMRNFLRDWEPPIALIFAELADPGLLLKLRASGACVLIYAPTEQPGDHGFGDASRLVLRGLLRQVSTVLTATDAQAHTLHLAGLPSGRSLVTGCLPNRPAPDPVDTTASQALAAQLAGRPSWLASDLSEEEEDIILTAYERTAQKAHRSLLVVQQSSPERAAAMTEKARAQGRQVVQRSTGQKIQSETQIVIADVPAEDALWARIVPLTFIGQTLRGVGGSSDPFVPASLGAAILHGPRFGTFASDYQELDRAGAARVVRDVDQLSRVLIELQAADKVAQMAHAAWDLATKSAEATALISDVILAEVAKRKAS
ncbi:3-deoxy-D-manno-octulosonic acid transferase [Actibacterium pelagium]|uniref:3-deoxy-D-manno-octulosonic acid transferase n=1 Tax=Actibacterium pelagium TaxID=2029103 RepID=A0A917EM93_9RHOB|nr:glycosyltransferase N-terminal domain-containing protein [Actibacterium pelagium]GGE56231.1 3-deoxy-D-manno-octulosonic acid transferase [Actibacterium pelagium]